MRLKIVKMRLNNKSVQALPGPWKVRGGSMEGSGPAGCATLLSITSKRSLRNLTESGGGLARRARFCEGGDGFSPQSGSPGGGLTATYRTPYEEPCAYELSAAEGVFLNSVFSYGFWP